MSENNYNKFKSQKTLKIFFIKLISILIAVVIAINLIFNLIFAERLEKIDKILLLNKSAFREEMRLKIRKELNKGLNKAAKVFSIELSKERHLGLAKRWIEEPRLNAIHGSSIDICDFPTIEQVTSMWIEGKTRLSNMPIGTILKWYKQDIDYMRQHGQTTSVVKQIKSLYQIKDFDFALIDGSEFTGLVDFELLYGTQIIVLDDVTTFKCYQARNILLMDENYELIYENINLRHGFAAFKRIESL